MALGWLLPHTCASAGYSPFLLISFAPLEQLTRDSNLHCRDWVLPTKTSEIIAVQEMGSKCDAQRPREWLAWRTPEQVSLFYQLERLDENLVERLVGKTVRMRSENTDSGVKSELRSEGEEESLGGLLTKRSYRPSLIL